MSESPTRRLPTREELRKKIADFWNHLEVADHEEDCTCSECLCATSLLSFPMINEGPKA